MATMLSLLTACGNSASTSPDSPSSQPVDNLTSQGEMESEQSEDGDTTHETAEPDNTAQEDASSAESNILPTSWTVRAISSAHQLLGMWKSRSTRWMSGWSWFQNDCKGGCPPTDNRLSWYALFGQKPAELYAVPGISILQFFLSEMAQFKFRRQSTVCCWVKPEPVTIQICDIPHT